jgi:hypothetical protein
MRTDELKEQIEELRAQLEELQRTEEDNLDAVTEASEEEDAPIDSPVEIEDHEDDDPKGELAASQSAILKEIALLRESINNSQENADKMRAILKRQGYDV